MFLIMSEEQWRSTAHRSKIYLGFDCTHKISYNQIIAGFALFMGLLTVEKYRISPEVLLIIDLESLHFIPQQ